MSAEEKEKTIIRILAPHERRLVRQMDTDTDLKNHFESLFAVTIAKTASDSQLTIEGDARALGLAKRGFAHLATFLVASERLDIKTLYDLAPTLAPERKEPMRKKNYSGEFNAANNNNRHKGGQGRDNHRGNGGGRDYDRGYNRGYDNTETGPRKEIPGILHSVAPKTKNQTEFMGTVARNTVTFGVGPAGTGKTFLASYMALKALEEGRIEKIFLARPAIGSGKDLGAMPGDMGEKLAPFMYPLYDELNKLAGTAKMREYMETGIVELAPIEFMRGRTFTNAFIIVDEAQNATFEQLKMALTRVGEGSKMVITGDPRQSDLKGDMAGGFDSVLKSLQNVVDVAQQHFSKEDIVRSKVVANILSALEAPQAQVAPVATPKPPQR